MLIIREIDVLEIESNDSSESDRTNPTTVRYEFVKEPNDRCDEVGPFHRLKEYCTFNEIRRKKKANQ